VVTSVSAKPIEVGHLINIIAGTELWSHTTWPYLVKFVHTGGSWRFYWWV